MDFGTLLHTAQKNGKGDKKEVRYYSTKFQPPKKEQRNKQQLSDNIKRFLAKKEAEEKAKKLEANRKREELMALRAKDKKATRTMNVMLKRTKSANQSVLQDAVDANNTSVTLAGPIQPDEDDYGYVSQEAAAFYNKMMEKYSKMPDEPKFNITKKKVSTDLNSTRERVKAAIEREKEEALMPHKRKRKHKEEVASEEPEPATRQEEAPRPKPRPAAPPPMNFNDLLKLAEKKQFEPIVIEAKPKEEEKPLTKKQKKEMEREKEWRERREGRLPPLEPGSANRIPKLGADKGQKSVSDVRIPKQNDLKKPIEARVDLKKSQTVKTPEITKKISKVQLSEKRPSVPSPNLKPSSSTTKVNSLNKPRDLDLKKKEIVRASSKDVAKKMPSRPDVKPKQLMPPPDVKPKQFPPKDLKPRQFPPPDVRGREFPPKDVRRKLQVNKGRILDDDEDYDSEMDDFIDDGPEEGEDYSKYISEIFGYDKSKYRYADDDIDNMESTFAQQMREEVISTKIGIMEDLEDMRQEEEDKKRKALLKKKGKL